MENIDTKSKLETVVVCVDHSNLRPLEMAFKLGLSCKTVVLYVEVLEEVDSLADPFHDKLSQVENYKVQTAGAKLQETVLGLIKEKTNFQFVKINTEKSAKYVIQEYCEKNHADLLIVGRSNSMIDHLFLGSVSKHLINNSTIPVLVARAIEKKK